MRIVEEAAQSEKLRIEEVFLTSAVLERLKTTPLYQTLRARQVRLNTVEPQLLDQWLGYRSHQNIACRVAALPSVGMQQLVANPTHNILALDRVQDPMNLGALVRSANATGLRAVICPKDHSTPLTEVVMRASAGAALHTPIAYVTNLARALDELKEAGYQIIALVAPKDHRLPEGTHIKPLHEFKATSPWVLVAGSEGSGLRPLVARQADFYVTIPMRGEVSSLNVSTASAVALFHLTHS